MASQTEDRLLEVLKAVGARVDSAVGTFTNLSSFGRMEQSEVGHQSQVPPPLSNWHEPAAIAIAVSVCSAPGP